MNFTNDNHAVISSSEVVFISVKPHLYIDMLSTLNKEGRQYTDKLWVSIMAGVVLSDLTAANFYRFFPNNPAKCALAKFIALLAKVYKVMSSRVIWNKENEKFFPNRQR